MKADVARFRLIAMKASKRRISWMVTDEPRSTFLIDDPRVIIAARHRPGPFIRAPYLSDGGPNDDHDLPRNWHFILIPLTPIQGDAMGSDL